MILIRTALMLYLLWLFRDAVSLGVPGVAFLVAVMWAVMPSPEVQEERRR